MSVDSRPLFEPLRINDMLTLQNRIVMAPMTRNRSPEGVPGEDVAAYYRRRAENDVGLIVTEGVAVDHPAAVGNAGLKEFAVPDMFGEAALAGWRSVVDGVHAAGGRIFPQLWHQGVMRIAGSGRFPDAPSMRPSGIWGPPGRRTSSAADYVEAMLPPTQPMTESEIADVIDAFARSARNAKAVGFDGIALHGGHGYLFDVFFWPDTNRRDDRFGGDLAGRARFATEVIRAIRREVGPAMPIMFRFSQWKQQDFDARIADTPDELGAWLGLLVDAGVDILDASTRMFDAPGFEGSDLSLAGWTRKLTGKPTMAVGSIGLSKDLYERPSETQAIAASGLDRVMARMAAGEFDLAGVGRSLIADPEWAVRARSGEPFKPYTLEATTRLY
ncbi:MULTISPECIES: NADH:flavin oxidoreductase [unclassified Sphingomonas]|uniref:NADH:flavin oxidoreductase n=1 Tax=unclassified Sphingomonas TaxID=196159 RepID=UPI0006F4F199|nr:MULTISPECIES: NADH:flavin oxidoreductase [unclassified Sphingomonas]KQX23532.1 1,2-oxophytodienoate reductase [Sphingomonas sp. Root1294]KQY68382.1 1,2-oxophytodienoate reductase [Sphingomonas sp. Root50]KRB91285.1 1,2-oxophytodienoate reductase [Sphingomonas sp. Root720]